MLRPIMNWFKTSILKQVVFEDDGITPVDCEGLQYVEGKYIISDEWSEWGYFGRGIYYSPRGGMQADMKNPFYLEDLQKALDNVCKTKLGIDTRP